MAVSGAVPTKHPDQTELDTLRQALASVQEEAAINNLLLGLGVALSEVKSIDDTIRLSVKLVPDVLGADRCFAAIAAPGAHELDIRAHFGFTEAEAGSLADLAARPGGLPLVERSLKEGRVLMFDDVSSDPETTGSGRSGTRSCAYIPLARWGQDLGVLGVEFDEPRSFTAQEEGLIRGVARQIAIALTNARRFTLLGELRAFGMRLGSKLRLADVIEEVIDGTRELLGAAAAAMYLVDASGSTMVRTEGRTTGPDTEASLPGSIDLDVEPWRELLAGEIAVAAVPDERGRLNLVFVPITKSGTGTIGAIAALLRRPLPLGPEEEEALTVLASQAVLAIETAGLFEQQRRVARTLQQGLVSTRLPDLPGFDIGAVYEPAAGEMEIGGDFYDVFEVLSGTFAVVLGDVSGKGAEAAARTSMAKYMLRAFASRNAAPTSVLFQLNNALADGFEDERFATLFYALLETDLRRFQVATGGHPEPLVYRGATGEVEILRPKGGLLGSFTGEQFSQVEVSLEPGDVLLAYTDGLIEARSRTDLYGLERLMASLAERSPEASNAKDLARSLYEDAARFGAVTDDTVVMVLVAQD